MAGRRASLWNEGRPHFAGVLGKQGVPFEGLACKHRNCQVASVVNAMAPAHGGRSHGASGWRDEGCFHVRTDDAT